MKHGKIPTQKISQPVNQISALLESLCRKIPKEIGYSFKLFDESFLVIIFNHFGKSVVVLDECRQQIPPLLVGKDDICIEALFGITGIAEILKTDLKQLEVNEDIEENITLIHQSAHSANQILENLLLWTRMQTDLLDLDPAEFSLADCIDECLKLYKVQARDKGVQFKFSDKVGGAVLSADRKMIATVFRNLISNAIKFSDTGDHIFIEVNAMDDVRKVTIRDEGIGMPEEIRQNVFNPADRPKRDGTDNEKGTGLGLLLCKEFVNMHNGEISVESEPGKGSEFRVTIPKELTTQNDQPTG